MFYIDYSYYSKNEINQEKLHEQKYKILLHNENCKLVVILNEKFLLCSSTEMQFFFAASKVFENILSQ